MDDVFVPMLLLDARNRVSSDLKINNKIAFVYCHTTRGLSLALVLLLARTLMKVRLPRKYHNSEIRTVVFFIFFAVRAKDMK